jgi:hypothetical protein
MLAVLVTPLGEVFDGLLRYKTRFRDGSGAAVRAALIYHSSVHDCDSKHENKCGVSIVYSPGLA